MLGILSGAYTLYEFSKLNLNAGYWDFFWPQFFQGVSLALLFVPLTTITMNPIPREKMGNATSLFNLMRNLGGSIGIAAVTTIQSRYSQKYVNILGSHVTPYNPASSSLLAQLQAGFVASGFGEIEAKNKSIAALFGMVQRQASMLSFIDVFRLMALIFLIMVPLVFFMKKPPKGQSAEMAH
jgi:MFS transporter, DHA2 family, multidrug resistance protein